MGTAIRLRTDHDGDDLRELARAEQQQGQHAHAAGYEGGIVLSNAVLHFPKKASYTLMPWCTYTDPELASIGLNEKQKLRYR